MSRTLVRRLTAFLKDGPPHGFAALLILLLINAANFFDRQILAAVTEPIRRDWNLTDTQIGWLGTAFTLLYAFAGLPFGRLADIRNRKRLLALGVTIWSGLTFLSGLTRGFWQLFAARLGVGVGEAVCAPASTSLIGDLFPPQRRARAMSIFMLGLPAGVALSYIVSGAIAQRFGWQAAFFVAGIPGFVLALAVLFIDEPVRGAKDPVQAASLRSVLAQPAIWWIIVSGALHNFAMYALTAFLPAFMMRYHGVSLQTAGSISGIAVGVVGGCGMLSAGWLADRVFRNRPGNRLVVAASAILLSVPAIYLALEQPGGAVGRFLLLFSTACFLLYSYYGVVYATIQDIVQPALRGTTMAIYLFAMYVLGASLGPVGMGWLSDYFAGAGAVTEASRALGLHRAMCVIPLIGLVLAVVLFQAARCTRSAGRIQNSELRIQNGPSEF
jgi:MFS family permease